jgi:hypothetical protein
MTVLLAHGAMVDRPDIDGATPLHIATMMCSPTNMTMLLAYGADANKVCSLSLVDSLISRAFFGQLLLIHYLRRRSLFVAFLPEVLALCLIACILFECMLYQFNCFLPQMVCFVNNCPFFLQLLSFSNYLLCVQVFVLSKLAP